MITVSLPFVIDTIYRTRQEVKHNREKGCSCVHPYIGMIDLDCPVHNPFYIRHYVTIDGRASTDKIYASYGSKEPICEECLTKILPLGYIVEWPIEDEELWCHSCGRVRYVHLLPERDLFLWKQKPILF